MRALKVPIATRRRSCARAAERAGRGRDTVEDLGRALARELVDGGDTPLWDARRAGSSSRSARAATCPLDAVVVARTAEPQSGQTARFLPASTRGSPPRAFRSSASRRPTREATAVPTYRGHGFSTVDDVDTIPGRVALAVLLTGESPGLVRDEGGQHARPAADRARRAGDRVKEPLTILVAARDEEATIGETVDALRARFPRRR